MSGRLKNSEWESITKRKKEPSLKINQSEQGGWKLSRGKDLIQMTVGEKPAYGSRGFVQDFPIHRRL